MADSKLSDLSAITAVNLASLLYVVQGGVSRQTTVSSLVSSISTHIWVSTPPANSTSTGSLGQMAFDTSSLYICVAANNWKKIALTSW
jgi:hypothetical protein